MLFSALFCVALATTRLAPTSLLGSALHRLMIEGPARWLNDATPVKAVVGVIVLVGLVGFALGAPEMVAVLGFGDLALYLDAVAISILLGAAGRLKELVVAAAQAGPWMLRRIRTRLAARPRRARRLRRKAPPRRVDEPEPGWLFA